MLKVHVEFVQDKMPLKIHDLARLRESAKLTIPGELNQAVLERKQASIPTRPPENLQRNVARPHVSLAAADFMQARRLRM